MTVLITGGTGFIGAEVVRLLLERGEQRPVVFHISSHTQRLGDVLDQVELVRGDLGNFNHILDVVKLVKPSAIYHLGLFYKRKYSMDYRCVRYPSIVGPGVKTPGAVQYTSWVIEECAKGKPFTIWAQPETRCPVLYFKDAARAIVQLADAPLSSIKTVNYLLAGTNPSASELADMVRARVLGAQVDFKPDPTLQFMLNRMMVRFDDSRAREEWSWEPHYTQDQMVDDFLREMKEHPELYA
jgi:nucleoside-diphosphate-sugar epimerase